MSKSDGDSAEKQSDVQEVTPPKATNDDENIEITEIDFLVDDIYTTKTNRQGHFRCTICNRMFNWSNAYRYHLKMHPHLKIMADSHKCQLCDRTFMTIRDLQSHCRNKHKVLNSFECASCKKSFNSAFQYNRHRNSCGTKVLCPKCNRTFPNKQTLQNHMRNDGCGSLEIDMTQIKVKQEVMSDDEEEGQGHGGRKAGASRNERSNNAEKNGNAGGESESCKKDETESRKHDGNENESREQSENETESRKGYESESSKEKEQEEGDSYEDEQLSKGIAGVSYTCNICLTVLHTEPGLRKHMVMHKKENNK